MTGDDLERAFYRDWDAGKVRRVSDGKRMVPEREWVGLTKEEARELCVANVPYVVDMVAALEAKLKEKNT